MFTQHSLSDGGVIVYAMRKGGRIWRATLPGGKRVTHAIPDTGEMRGYLDTPALCGDTPSGRSYGWVPVNGRAVTCPKCLKIMQAQGATVKDFQES